MTGAGCTWVLDLVARDGKVLLSATDTRLGVAGTAPVAGWSALQVADALLSIVGTRVAIDGSVERLPTKVITDGSHLFEGIGATIGAEQQIATFTDLRRLARLEKLL